MLNTKEFGQILKKEGFDFYSGVPCSFLKYLINYAINKCDFVMAANEGDAVAICAGAYMAGKKSVLLCQNSGLANSISPLTSLNPIFKIPLLGFVSLRGEPGLGDQPQHEMMGTITTKTLDLIDIEWEFLSDDLSEAKKQVERATKVIEQNKSFFFVVKKGTFSEEPLDTPLDTLPSAALGANGALPPKRLQALEVINRCKDKNTVLLATTGGTGRELYEIEDSQNNFYMVGSMGCVSSIALGIVKSQNNKSVIAIDGDGALLMRLGSMPTNAAYTKKNMLHILLDNNAHDSTGGQATVATNVDFVTIATASGYPRSIQANNLDEFEKHINDWKKHKELTFLYLKISKGKKEGLGRPKIKPYEVKERLMRFL
jgi:phosphonopyruvate decarboxylase